MIDLKFQDVKDALEHNGKCSINNYIFTLEQQKDKLGRTLTRVYMHEIDTKIPGSDEEWIAFYPEFKSFQQFRYFLAKQQMIED